MKMQTVGAFEAKTHFSSLLEKVERGEQVTITKHGHPIAKLVPAMASKNREVKRNAIQKILELSQQHKLAGLNWKELRDEGRNK